MKKQCCVTPGGQTDEDSSQKHFLSFRVPVLQNVKTDPDFPQKHFFCFIQRKISLAGEKNLG